MKSFTETDLVTFGNYLLSEERKKRTSVKNRGHVTHSDMENWKLNKDEK